MTTATSASPELRIRDEDCRDLAPGKIASSEDVSGKPKSRPPSRLTGHARGFDTSTAAPWRTLRDAGYAYAFVQAAIGTSKNKDFAVGWDMAKRCGFPRGAYQFVSSGGDGAAQAAVMLDALQDDFGELPPTLDLEQPPGCKDACCETSCSIWTSRVDAWLAAVEGRTKKKAMLYMVEPFYAECLCGTTKWSDRALWLAAWPRFDFPERARLGGFGTWTFYQYEGNVLRHGGVIDLNLFMGDRAAFDAWLAARR